MLHRDNSEYRRRSWITLIPALRCLGIGLALLLSAPALAMDPSPVLLPAATIDTLDYVHLNWFMPQLNDRSIPESLPPPTWWLESSPDQNTAVARSFTCTDDSAALYALNFYMRNPDLGPYQVELWSDSADLPGHVMSLAYQSSNDAAEPNRTRFLLSQPVRIDRKLTFWAVIRLPKGTPTAFGVYPDAGTVALVAPYTDSGTGPWQPWPDFDLDCALVLARQGNAPITASDTAVIDIYRIATAIADTAFVDRLDFGQTSLSDLPTLPGYDFTYVWADSVHNPLATLTVPYSQVTALAWTELPSWIAINDGDQVTAHLTNRSLDTLQVTVNASCTWDSSDVALTSPPVVTVTPDRLVLPAQTSADIVVSFDVPPSASGRALLALTAVDSSTFAARPARCSTVLQIGATGIESPGLPVATELTPYPNPTNGGAVIPLPPGARTVDIYNLLGARLARIRPGPETRQIVWPDTRSPHTPPTGVYYIRIHGSGIDRTCTLTLIK